MGMSPSHLSIQLLRLLCSNTTSRLVPLATHAVSLSQLQLKWKDYGEKYNT
jgi:hypothetical protein